MTEMMKNIDSIQQYTGSLIKLSVVENNISMSVANQWLFEMSGGKVAPSEETNDPTQWAKDMKDGKGSDLQEIKFWATQTDSTAPQEVNVYTTQFNTHNNLYNQSNTFYSGINNGTNENSSTATQTISTDLEMFQQGPLSEITNLTQCL